MAVMGKYLDSPDVEVLCKSIERRMLELEHRLEKHDCDPDSDECDMPLAHGSLSISFEAARRILELLVPDGEGVKLSPFANSESQEPVEIKMVAWESTVAPCAVCDCTDASHRKHLLDLPEKEQEPWKLFLTGNVPLPLVKSFKLTHGKLVLCTWCEASVRQAFEPTRPYEIIEELNGKLERCLAILNEGR